MGHADGVIPVLHYLSHDYFVVESRVSNRPPTEGASEMHELLIGLTFVGMVISPAIVAAFSGSSEAEAND